MERLVQTIGLTPSPSYNKLYNVLIEHSKITTEFFLEVKLQAEQHKNYTFMYMYEQSIVFPIPRVISSHIS